jgi:hypothetical protein
MGLQTNYMLIAKELGVDEIRARIIALLGQASNNMYQNYDEILTIKSLSDPNMDKNIFKLGVNYGTSPEEADLRQIKKTFENLMGNECRNGNTLITVFEYEGEFKLVNII